MCRIFFVYHVYVFVSRIVLIFMFLLLPIFVDIEVYVEYFAYCVEFVYTKYRWSVPHGGGVCYMEVE